MKMWVAIMYTLDMTRGPPGLGLMPPLMGHETQDTKEICHLEPKIHPPRSGHGNPLAKWELHEQSSGSSF